VALTGAGPGRSGTEITTAPPGWELPPTTAGAGRGGAAGAFDATGADTTGAAVADAVAEAVGVALAVGVGTGVLVEFGVLAGGALLLVTVCGAPGSPICVRKRAAPAPSANAARPAAAHAAT